jgi:hypothetical protein
MIQRAYLAMEGRKEGNYIQDQPIGLKTENLGYQINRWNDVIYASTALNAIIHCSSQHGQSGKKIILMGETAPMSRP